MNGTPGQLFAPALVDAVTVYAIVSGDSELVLNVYCCMPDVPEMSVVPVMVEGITAVHVIVAPDVGELNVTAALLDPEHKD